MLITTEKLQAFVESIFRAAGSNAGEAEVVAAHLVEANLTGHDSHGISLIPEYMKNVAAGNIRPNQVGGLVRRDGSILVYDGNLGYGQAVAKVASLFLAAISVAMIRAGILGMIAAV